MTPPDEPRFIATDEAWAAMAESFAAEPLLAVDTEAASFHRFVDRVYLIQVSSRTRTAIIDPLAVGDLSSLGQLLASPSIEIVFHDADYDLRSLDRDYGFRIQRVFDTRIAAQLLGEPGIGLGALLQKHFNVTLDKRFQRADWSQRPLAPDMLAYAAADTAHLPALRDRLQQQLRDRGRHHWATEEFERLPAIRWTPPAEADAYLRIKGARLLPPRSLAVLRALHRWRDEQARALDRATFRIIANEALLALARLTPASRDALDRVPELPPSIARRHADALLATIAAALSLPEEEWPRVERTRGPRPDPEIEERVERLKVLRNERARELALDPGVLCPNGTLEAIARVAPQSGDDLAGIAELRKWQREVLGDAAILAAQRPPAT